MPATVVLLLAALVFGPWARADSGSNSGEPFYSSASIVNAAANIAGPLAPNSIATIYGANLSYSTRGITQQDVQGGSLPYVLANTGVRVWVNNIAAALYFVSPSQINFLVPSALTPGTATVVVTMNGHAGPAVTVDIAPAAPAFFQFNAQEVAAAHADGTPVSDDQPARPGEIVVLYATGLGQTAPPVVYAELATKAASIQNQVGLQILVGGSQVDAKAVYYAGLAPGFAGLYQINLQLPSNVGPNPEIRVGTASVISPANLIIPVRP